MFSLLLKELTFVRFLYITYKKFDFKCSIQLTILSSYIAVPLTLVRTMRRLIKVFIVRHYANILMQYAGIFKGCKNTIFFGSAVGRGAVLCNARRRRRIRTGSIPTSVMKKRMNNIPIMVVKTRFASITEGKLIIHRILKEKYLFYMNIFDIFLIFAQNIDCGYTLEPPQSQSIDCGYTLELPK